MSAHVTVVTAISDSLPPDLMVHQDEISLCADFVLDRLYPHRVRTGCNLDQGDFLPGDGHCADGGAMAEHPPA